MINCRSRFIFISLCILVVTISACSPPISISSPKNENPTQPKSNFNPSDITIGLDPGHGWQGVPGAVSDGIQEKDVNLSIAFQTKKVLESNGFKVVLTRSGDDDHALNYAAQYINSQNPNIVISIHANSSSSFSSGTEACYTVGKTTDGDSQLLGQLITDSISNKLSMKNRGVFPENSDSRCARKSSTGWNQLYIHDMNPPSVVIETAFINNPIERDLLINHSEDFAQAIVDGIISFFNNKYINGQVLGNSSELLRAQLGFDKSWYVIYDSSLWESKVQQNYSDGTPIKNLDGEKIEELIHKQLNCRLIENLGRGAPETWHKYVYEKKLGTTTYQVEEWTDTISGKQVLIVYHYPPKSWDNYRRLELIIDDDAEKCIRDAEELIMQSNEEITK